MTTKEVIDALLKNLAHSTEQATRVAELERRIAEHDLTLVDLHGRSGNNGKVGELRRDVDELKGLLTRVALYAATGGIGGGGAVVGIAKLWGG